MAADEYLRATLERDALRDFVRRCVDRANTPASDAPRTLAGVVHDARQTARMYGIGASA